MSSYLTSKNTISLAGTVFEIYSISKILGFDLDLWPQKVIWGQKKSIRFESPCMTYYLTFMDTISLSRTVLEIFDFKVFRIWPWPLTPKGHLGSKKITAFERSKKLRHSKAHIWLPIWLLWTPSLSLVPFSRYSTSKFLGFDLDLWPRKVIWSWKKFYHSKANIWLPIWHLWTPSLYLVPFSRYSTSKFLGFDLDLLPQNVIQGPEKLYNSIAHIWLTIRPLWTPSLYLVPFSRYSTSKFLGLILTFDPKRSSGVEKKYTIREPIYDILFDLYGHHLSSSYRSKDIRLQIFQGSTLTFDPKRSSGGEKIYGIRKPIYDFLFDFYEHHLSISCRFRDIRLQSF